MIGLEAEFALAADGVTGLVLERFRQWGIPNRILFGPRHHVGVAKIVTTSDGFFEFHDDGARAAIIPEGMPEWPGWDEIHDLVAFMPFDPARWWRRRSDVDILGASNMTPWRLSPLIIHETPLSWLQGGCTGICIVDWGFDPNALLAAGHLEIETPALRRRLQHRITEAALAPFNITDIEEVRHVA